jgi:hypothetical protein
MLEDAKNKCGFSPFKGGECFINTKTGMEKCKGYISFPMENTQTGEVKESYKCSLFEWQPIFIRDVVIAMRGNQAAVESMRNETVMRQDLFLDMAKQSAKRIDRQ